MRCSGVEANYKTIGRIRERIVHRLVYLSLLLPVEFRWIHVQALTPE
jgi:hypothetical protein